MRHYISGRISAESQKAFEFGWFPPNEHLDSLYDFIDAQELENSGLLYEKIVAGGQVKTGHFNQHNLVLPFRDEYGEVASIVGRTLMTDEQRTEVQINKYKYTFSNNKQNYLFGLNLAKESILKQNAVLVVEGQFDCIALHERGITNAVAAGCAHLSVIQMSKLIRYSRNIYMMLDNDEAGENGLRRVLNRFGNFVRVTSVPIPDNQFKDIADFFMYSKNESFKNSVVQQLKSINN